MSCALSRCPHHTPHALDTLACPLHRGGTIPPRAPARRLILAGVVLTVSGREIQTASDWAEVTSTLTREGLVTWRHHGPATYGDFSVDLTPAGEGAALPLPALPRTGFVRVRWGYRVCISEGRPVRVSLPPPRPGELPWDRDTAQAELSALAGPGYQLGQAETLADGTTQAAVHW